MGDVIFRHTCCYFSPHQFRNLPRQCPTLDPRVASQRWECHSLKRATFLETNSLSMLQHLLDSIFLQVHHRRLPPFKPIYFARCHNLNLFSVCPCNELFVGNSFSDITVTFEMSLWSFLFSLSNIFSRTRENGTKSK